MKASRSAWRWRSRDHICALSSAKLKKHLQTRPVPTHCPCGAQLRLGGLQDRASASYVALVSKCVAYAVARARVLSVDVRRHSRMSHSHLKGRLDRSASSAGGQRQRAQLHAASTNVVERRDHRRAKLFCTVLHPARAHSWRQKLEHGLKIYKRSRSPLGPLVDWPARLLH